MRIGTVGKDRLLREARCGLAYALAAQTAFQFLLKTWSEVLEIALFAAIVGAYLAVRFAGGGVRGLVDLADGSWTQRLAALFLLCLMVTFIWGDHSVRSALALLRLPTYLVIIAMVVDALRQEARVPALAWVILGSITPVFALILVEFYFGNAAVGLECADVAQCAAHEPADWSWTGLLYLLPEGWAYGAGRAWIEVNLNVSIIAKAYGLSRLALFATLGYALGIGLILTSRGQWPKLLAGGLVAVAVFTMLLSGSRSGVIGMAMASGVFIVLVAVSLRSLLLPIAGAMAVFIAAGGLLLAVLPAGETTLGRVSRMFEREPRLAVNGLAAGEERLVAGDDSGASASAAATVVGHRFGGLAAGQEYLVRLRALGEQGRRGEWTDPIAVVAQNDGAVAGDGECGAGRAGCGSFVLTWYEPEDPEGSVIGYWVALRGRDAAAGPSDWWSNPWQRSEIVPALRGRQQQTAAAAAMADDKGYSVARVVTPDAGRIRNWQLALDLFAANPAGGNGYRTFQPEARQAFFDTNPVGVHNGYLEVLSESGLLGGLPMLGLFAGAVALMLRLGRGASERAVLWRNVFLSVLAAFLALNLLDTHSSDRYFWVVLAFAGVAEVWRRQRAAAAKGDESAAPAAGTGTGTGGDANRS